MSQKAIQLIFSFILLFTLFFPFASAVSVRDAHTEVELIAEADSMKPGNKFWAGVRFKMDPGWHIYWKNPGDAGLATEIEWKLPEGFSSGPILWPYPKKISQPPLVSYGYEGEVLLMSEIQTSGVVSTISLPLVSEGGGQVGEGLGRETSPYPSPFPPLRQTTDGCVLWRKRRRIRPRLLAEKKQGEGNKIEIKADVKWLACEKICIPGKAKVTLELSADSTDLKPAVHAPEDFTKDREALPLQKSDWAVKVTDSRKNFAIDLSPPASMNRPLKEVYFFPEKSDWVQHAAAQKLKKTKNGYRLEVPKAKDLSEIPDRIRGVLVTGETWGSADFQKALEIDAAVER